MPEKTIFEQIKAQNGEVFAKTIRSYHNGIFDIPDIVNIVKYAGRDAEPLLGYLKSLVAPEIEEHGVYESPLKLLDRAGYDAFYADTQEKQDSIQNYYAPGEKLCTFGSNRYQTHYIVHAVKKNVDEIKRENFPNPRRDDEYGTSVISIQMRKEGNHISIKNRYNHTVENCDNTFNSNPDNIILGLSESLRRHFNVDFSRQAVMLPDGYIEDNERIIKHHGERNNVYFGDSFYVQDGVVHELDKRTEVMLDRFIYNNETKTLSNPANLDDAFIDAFKQETEGKKIRIDKDKKTKHIHVFANGTEILEIYDGQIVNLNFPSITEIGSVERDGVLRRFMGGLPNLRRVKGNLNLSGLGLTKLPDLSHVVIDGSFVCDNNQLTTLEGCPKEVGGYFWCNQNQLTTLEGGPKEVGGSFNCYNNRLTTLVGGPEKVSGNFICHHNQLTTLEGGPKEVGGSFWCHGNQLTTLKGCPKEVGGDFNCYHNQLTTLEGGPKEVGGDFICSHNQLATLEGAPEEVGCRFSCSDNQLTTLVGAPKEVGGDFDCSDNQLTTLEWAPEEVGGDFNCYNNRLTTLVGGPEKVGGDFNCSYNKLSTLEGGPQEVGGGFYCNNNQLSTLEGGPQEVGGDFVCYRNQLSTLEGGPQEVGGTFDCSDNQLSTLEGGPQEVGGSFGCSDNQLSTLEGFPRKIGGIVRCFSCGVDENSTAPEYLSSAKIEGIDDKLLEKMIENWKKIHGQSGALYVAANQINTKAQNETNPHLNEDASRLIAKIKHGKGK